MIAYFIGGSLDLSKRAVLDDTRTFHAPKLPPLHAALSPEQVPPTVFCEIENYRLIARRFNGREEIAVFMLDER